MKVNRRELFLTAAAARALPGVTGGRRLGRVFEGEALREIAFPLGGIGTGMVSLGGYGNLRDWEIFNRPNKGSVLPFTFAALRLAGGGLARPLVRVVERHRLPPYSGGFGEHREQAVGLPHFRDAVFTGAYPFAGIELSDPVLPVTVALEAFNPMIPLDTGNSSYPVAVLTYRVTSHVSKPMDATLAFSLMNAVGYDGKAKLYGRLSDRQIEFFGGNVNEFRGGPNQGGLLLSSKKYAPDSPRFGSLALVSDCPDLSCRLAWEHGAWWDDFQKWWDEFLTVGRFDGKAAPPSAEGTTEYSTLAAHFALAPGETRGVTFVLGWHFPNMEGGFQNHYGTRWPSAWEPAAQVMDQLPELRRRSMAYRDALFGSTLPDSVVDAVSSQASIIRTPTVMVAKGKLTLAFEGCGDNEGCCAMNCTHVFNYEQSMAFLFPDLERSMRETDFLMNMRPDGSMSFRTPVPLKMGGNNNHPAADGQMGCVLKVYREWQLSGDDGWLRKLWPQVKRALEYAWTKWDADRDGVMEGEQHNTYDINFYGANSMMGTLYLGALAAGARMARHLGDQASAATYDRLREAGSAKLDRTLWNGEYYIQQVDESRKEASRYQYGAGCLSDQLLGQWFAEITGLGDMLPHQHVRAALQSIFRYNFRRRFDELANTQRLFALNDEAGLLLCSWPKGKRPALPFVYSDEVWTGIEYQVAAHLIYEGMVEEGVTIVQALRNRYDGVRRNPWDEVECGHHYARAMASWSLLTAFSGFRYTAAAGDLRFRPAGKQADFRCLFSAGTGWGIYSQSVRPGSLKARVEVTEGSVQVRTLRLPFAASGAVVECSAPGVSHTMEAGELVLRFADAVKVVPGKALAVAAKTR